MNTKTTYACAFNFETGQKRSYNQGTSTAHYIIVYRIQCTVNSIKVDNYKTVLIMKLYLLFYDIKK